MSFNPEKIEYALVQASATLGEPVQLALKHIRVGELARGLAVLNLALSKNEQNAQLHGLIGVVEYEFGDAYRGLEQLELATALPSCDESIWCNYAHILQRMRQYEKALKAYQQAILIAPQYAEAHSGCGNVYLEEGDWERAYALYTDAINYAPKNASYYNNRGVVGLKLGKLGQALLDLQQACTLQAIDLHQINFAEAYATAGQTLVALETLANVTAAGRDSSYFAVLGKIHAQSGAAAAAIESFKKALLLNEHNLDAFEACAAVYFGISDAVSAQNCIRQCLDIRPNSLRYRYLDCLYAIPLREASSDTAIASQRKFMQKVDRLQNWLEKDPRPLAALRNINFVAPSYFLYSSDSSASALQKYHELQKIRMPKETAVAVSAAADAVCIVTARVNDTEYSALFLSPLLQELNRLNGENTRPVHLISIGLALPEILDAATTGHVVHDLEAAVEVIQTIKPKALIYADVGTNYLTYALAGMRLAPLQLQAWSAGCGWLAETMDGLLVPELFAGADFADVQPEKIVFYPQCLEFLAAEKVVNAPIVTASLERVIVCAANTLKYQGEYVELVLDVLQQHEHARLIITNDFGYSSLNLKNDILKRAASRGLAVQERIVFASGDLAALLKGVPYRQALVLDSLPYSDFATVQAALELEIPVVAMRGPELHGQLGAQLLTALGLAPMLVAESLSEYAELSDRLLSDTDYYAQARAKLAAIKSNALVSADVMAVSNTLAYCLGEL